MKHFSKETIFSVSYDQFLPYLKRFYLNEVVTPKRPHYSLPSEEDNATLLLMPSWQSNKYIGTKIITVFPDNAKLNRPTIQGIFLLFDGVSGELLATFDGPSLTTVRTAAVSGLASNILASPLSTSLLMIGTGKLCHHLIRAHASRSNLTEVYIWGRSQKASIEKAESLSIPGIHIKAVSDKESIIANSDIISCATFSPRPLVQGKLLKAGSHLDLVGSYTPSSREADNDCLVNAEIFVDDFNAIEESGDLVIPIKEGIIQKEAVLGDLMHLCKQGYNRTSSETRTFFKSVGNAKSDLALASFLMQQENER